MVKSNQRSPKNSQKDAKSLVFDEITTSPKYQILKTFYQHGSYTVYDHSINVYNTCFKMVKKHHLKVDEKALTRAALLHDYFLYDWHDKDCPKHHFTQHPRRAAKNAKRDFGLTEKEEKAILSHMFPAGLKIPSTKEAIILTLADKRCAAREFFHSKRHRRQAQKDHKK